MALRTQTYTHHHPHRMPAVYMAEDTMSMRSSGEDTAATIFSMYEDPVPADTKHAPPVPVLDPKYRSLGTDSSRPVSTFSETGMRRSREGYGNGPPVSYNGWPESATHSRRTSASRRSYGTLENNRPSIGTDRPAANINAKPGERYSIASNGRHSTTIDRTRADVQPSYTQDPGPSFLQDPQRGRGYSTRQSSLQSAEQAVVKPLPASRTPSPRLAMNSVPHPSGSSPVSPQDSVLLTPGERERRTSSKHSTHTVLTSQTSHTTPTSFTEYTTRHSSEDADAFRIRATYARLEAEGVPGDGWLEGVERTRTRVVSAASAAVLEASRGVGGKGAEVSAEEAARLRSTDRYGFFSQPGPAHEGRLALLPSPPLKTFASPHKPAPTHTSTAIPSLRTLTSLPGPTVDPKEGARISKWGRMLLPAASPGSGGSMGGTGGAGWRWDPRKVHKRTERVFKGVPDRWRTAAWGTLVEEKAVRPRQTRRMGVAELSARYRELLDAPSEHDVQIDLDVPRTISGHVMFHTRYGQGQRSLFYVLHAFSQLCPSCGYVQGMGPIAATLLNYFDPERTYAILVRLHDEYEMHTIFQPGFPGLLESIYVQERLIERLMPGVYQALSKHMISSTSFVTKWYITLFANTVPFQTQLRLWDAFLLEGRDVLVVAAVAILWIVKDHVSSPQANFETILSLLSSTFVFEDEDAFLKWMERLLTDRQLRDEMDGWRAEWGRLVAEGKSGKALL